MANCVATLGHVLSASGCAPAAGTRTRIYIGNYADITLDAEGSGANLGKVPGFTMASTKVLYAMDIYQDTGVFEEKYTQDSATWDTSVKGLIKSLAAAARNVFNDHAGAKIMAFVPLKSGPIKIIGCDDGAFLATNDASSAAGNVGEAFTYTAKAAAKKATKAVAKKAAAKPVAEEPVEAGIDDAVIAKITEVAMAANDYDEFVANCYADITEVAEDEVYQKLVEDQGEDGIWGQVVAAWEAENGAG